MQYLIAFSFFISWLVFFLSDPNNMIEHLSTPDVPEMLKYDYQEMQTVWKTRMETEDKAF